MVARCCLILMLSFASLVRADEGGGLLFAPFLRAAGFHPTLIDAGKNTPSGAVFVPEGVLPTSFVYGGQSSSVLLPAWQRGEVPAEQKADRTIYRVTWKEPGTGFSATWRATIFKDRPAIEFQWSFANEGSAPAKLLTEVSALDLQVRPPDGKFEVLSSSGGLDGSVTQGALGFELSHVTNQNVALSAFGGRSSNHSLPFFVIRAPQASEGIYVGVGWSGQWQGSIAMTNGELTTRLGMPGMNLALPPGEHIIAPSILLGAFSGDSRVGTNALRRILCDKYVPLLDGKKPLPPVSWNHWFILENAISEASLEKQADYAAAAGVEYFCIDAGWFDGDFPNGVGNWTLNTIKFPNGIGAVGDYVNKKGMKLGLWFEPERAAAGTKLAKDHPDWVHGDLVDFGNPAVQDWAFNLIKHYYDHDHVRWIRWDFNMEPIFAWNVMDGPDQKRLAQIRHVMGLYRMLDRLMAACPDLLIEGCASGGRRIDLETIKRSHTFWKSDNTDDLPTLRFHETGANTFLPGGLLNVNVLPQAGKVAFDVASVFGGPLGFRADWPKLSEADRATIAKLVSSYKKVRPLLDADYYPLFAQQRTPASWTGWQFDDPEKGAGFFVLLRPGESPYGAADVALQGLDPAAQYEITNLLPGGDGKDAVARRASGAGLSKPLPYTLSPESAVIYSYQKVP